MFFLFIFTHRLHRYLMVHPISYYVCDSRTVNVRVVWEVREVNLVCNIRYYFRNTKYDGSSFDHVNLETMKQQHESADLVMDEELIPHFQRVNISGEDTSGVSWQNTMLHTGNSQGLR